MSRFGQIHVQFELCIVSYSESDIKEQLLCTHISHLSHWTALWEFKTAPLHMLHPALQFEQYQESLPDSIFCNSTGPRFTQDAWKRFSQSSHLSAFSAALQYFLHVRHWNLGPGFISISPAKIIRINKFVPFEGLKLRNPSELLRLPIFLVKAKL